MLDNLFNMSDEKLDIKTEFIAGLTTFLAMSYVLGVNPTMLADAGMPATSVFFSTALAAGIACIVMGLISKYPVGLAPGMGMNALFTYTVVLGMGLSWNAALAAVFVSTLIFFLITITGLRETIVRIIPKDLKLAIGAGIGLFLAFIGLKGAGIIVADPANLVGLGALTSAPALLALIGILITIVLYIKKVPASVFSGLIITAIIGVIFTAAGFGVGGDIFMPAIPKEIISFSFDTTVLFGFASGFGELFSTNPLDLIMILFSFLFFIFFDTTGTLISLAQSAGFPEDENGEFKGIKNAFIGDAVGGLIGVILGTSPQTAYVESSTGIGVGGRTGLTAVFTGIFFLIAIVFSPLILSLFTSPVTACALVMVGILMMGQLKEVEWDNLVSVAAVFATIVMMLLTYSITLGIAFGFVTYAVAAIADGKAKEMHPLVWVLIIIFAIYLFFGL